MQPAGRRRIERLPQLDLHRRVLEQVAAAHHVVDPVGNIVGDHGEVVRHDAVPANEDRIAERPRVGLLGSPTTIDERDDARPQGEAHRAVRVSAVRASTRTAGAWWQREFAHRARAPAAVESRREAGHGSTVIAHRLPRDFGVPCEAEPGEIVTQCLFHGRTGAFSIDVLDAQQQTPVIGTRRKPRRCERAHVAKMQQAGGRGSEPADGGGGPIADAGGRGHGAR